MDPLERLTAIEDIKQLAYSYAFAVDTLDWGLMETLWVNTDQPAPPPVLDIHAIRQLPGKFAEQGASMLFVGNHRITFESAEKARGTVYCQAFVDRGHFLEQAIIYLDEYERHAGNWLFLKRNHLLLWGKEGASNPMQQPPANWPKRQVGAGNAAEILRNVPNSAKLTS